MLTKVVLHVSLCVFARFPRQFCIVLEVVSAISQGSFGTVPKACTTINGNESRGGIRIVLSFMQVDFLDLCARGGLRQT